MATGRGGATDPSAIRDALADGPLAKVDLWVDVTTYLPYRQTIQKGPRVHARPAYAQRRWARLRLHVLDLPGARFERRERGQRRSRSSGSRSTTPKAKPCGSWTRV